MDDDDLDRLDLPQIARLAVADALELGDATQTTIVPPPSSEPLAATFVTIMKAGELRGCMGTTVARRPLLDDVRSQARAAAFRDPRFPPVNREELTRLSFEVSVLGAATPLEVHNWEEACGAVRPERDGVIVRTAVGGALFLPQVWEKLERSEEFLDRLWKKAGLPERYFESDVELSIFGVRTFAEG